ncbi:hypothetical protein SPD89_06650 [Pseudogracilibacillus sp. SO30301A]
MLHRQQGRKRWILKVKKTLRRQTWRERVISSDHKDPMICPYCDNYYDYMGEVCPLGWQTGNKSGINRRSKKLFGKGDQPSRRYQARAAKKGREKVERNRPPTFEEDMCHEEEEIPYDVVREFDLMDGGDPSTPPRFSCENCGGRDVSRVLQRNTWTGI